MVRWHYWPNSKCPTLSCWYMCLLHNWHSSNTEKWRRELLTVLFFSPQPDTHPWSLVCGCWDVYCCSCYSIEWMKEQHLHAIQSMLIHWSLTMTKLSEQPENMVCTCSDIFDDHAWIVHCHGMTSSSANSSNVRSVKSLSPIIASCQTF